MAITFRRTSLVLTSTLAAAALLLTGCTQGSDSSAAESSTPGTIQVGVIPTATTANVYIAEDEGYFAEEGLTVEMQVIQNAASVAPSVLNGQLQFGTAATPPFITAAAKGLPLKAVANAANVTDGEAVDDSALLVGVDSDVTRPRELEGKTVAVNALSAMMHITAAAAVEADGGNPADVTFVAMSFPEMVTSLQRGTVDAVSILEPFYSQSLQDGSKAIGHPFTGSLKHNGTSALFFAAEDYIAENPETVEKFVRALDKASVKAAEDPSVVKAVLKKYGGMSDAALADMKLPGYSAGIDPEALEQMQAVMIDQGFLEEGQVEVQDLIWKP